MSEAVADEPDAANVDGRLVDALAQTTFMTMAVLNGVAAEYALSLTQLRALAILRDRRVRMSELASYLGLDRSTMSGLVDRSEKRGLVTRSPSPEDGRAVEVCLSPDGTALADVIHPRIAAALAPAVSRLRPGEQSRLLTLLERLIDSQVMQ